MLCFTEHIIVQIKISLSTLNANYAIYVSPVIIPKFKVWGGRKRKMLGLHIIIFISMMCLTQEKYLPFQ